MSGACHEFIKGVGGAGVWPNKIEISHLNIFSYLDYGEANAFYRIEKRNILVPRYDLSKSAVFCDFFAKCIQQVITIVDLRQPAITPNGYLSIAIFSKIPNLLNLP